TVVPVIQPYSVRKVAFFIKGKAPAETGSKTLKLYLKRNGAVLTEENIELRVVAPDAVQKHTYISEIDGSVQYYALNPALTDDGKPKALFFSVHGANVEALNQAGAYYPKKWGHIVAPTNRRPFGYDWEDWGRLDALEVLNLVKKQLKIDPARIYLTGHSMGGHGTWHLGATFPDQFAAIGPSAGWISFFSYAIRDTGRAQSPLEKMLMRAASPSRTLKLAENYKQLGVYIIHGDSDKNVPVQQSRKMAEVLKKIGHKDFVYHEEAGAGHWWDRSDEPGADCVDWMPLFDFFARHARPTKEQIRQIDFTTASPGVSASDQWITIFAQEKPFDFSRISIRVDPGKRRFVGNTENVARLKIDLAPLTKGEPFSINIDGQIIDQIDFPAREAVFLEKRAGQWQISGEWSKKDKGPHRFGGLKDAFRHRVVFVVGTNGSREENAWAIAKARYDAEVFWYQGNGSIDIITDREFDPQKYADRNVILYGNANTNSAWQVLLKNCPVQVMSGKIQIGGRKIEGKDLAALFVYPREDSDIASIGVVAGTGISGMRATNTQRYLYAGYAYPDLMIFRASVYSEGYKSIRVAGYFDTRWRLNESDIIFGE
ncbi:MAG: prolyl oligopeptidase family serine peptidase, partial [Calditrichaeota bacterium]|nr:prolyl oligopeptidase family serine peptidase [Calditrichota bacterium]